MSQNNPNRIPAEKLGYCRDWALPEFDVSGGVLASAEKESRDQRGGREYVEDVEQTEDDQLAPLTAETLAEITKAAAQEGYQSGFTKGEKHGYEAGFNAGKQAAEQQIADEMARISQVSNTLAEPMQGQQDALEQLVLSMVTGLAETVIKRELITDSGHILALVKEAIAALPVGKDQLKLYANPDDLAVLETYAEAEQKPWTFVPDVNILPGGCRIETKESLVDFSVEKRMHTVFEQFIQRQYARSDDDDSEPAQDADLDSGE